MEQEDNRAGEKIGWHVIARGGDMTARVHGGMYLGEGASGDLSFEPVDGVVALAVEGDQLKLTIVRPDQELLVPGEHPARAVLVSPQTRVSLSFRKHTLDIDNDFAFDHPSGGALHIEVIDAGSAVSSAARTALGPVSAGRRQQERGESSNRTIVVSEASVPLWTSPDDHQPHPEHGMPVTVRRPLLLGGVLMGLVAALLILAVYLPSRMEAPAASNKEPAASNKEPAASNKEPAASSDQAPAASNQKPAASNEQEPAAPLTETAPSDPEAATFPPTAAAADAPSATSLGEPVAFELEPADSEQTGDAAVTVPPSTRTTTSTARVSDELLARFSALIEADSLPDRNTIDFLVETLKSLNVAYPDDARVPEALEALTLKLLDGARERFDAGDAFQAGRLVELAATTGAARIAVQDTLADFSARPPPAVAARAVPAATSSGVDPSGETGNTGNVNRVESPATSTAGGLDALIHQATGPLGALAVSSELPEPEPVRMPAAASEPLSSAVELPEGFVLEDPRPADGEAMPDYLPFNELVVTRREPLAFPAGAVRRRGVSVSVEVSFTVTETGAVTDLEADDQAEPAFADAAVNTIARWAFEPVVRDGRPTPVRTTIRVTFRG